MATLPLLVGALTWALVHRWRETLGLGRLSARGTLLVGFALLSGLVVAISELSSVGHRFTTTTVAAAWTVLAVVLAAAAVASGAVDARRLGRAITVGWRTASMPERAALAVAAAYVALLAAAALLYRPRTADSMMYHLTRVEHWVQNRSVAPFATHMVAQVDMAPLHEYGLAHLHLLTGSDRFDGLVQLLAYAMVVVGASELTRLLGGARLAQVLAAMLALTLPSAVLEASSTQNDLMGAAAGLTLVTMIAAWDTRPGAPYLPRAVIIGLAGALAFLAKGTVLPTIGPTALALSVLWAFREVRTGGARTAVTRVGASAAVAVVAALLVAGPFAARNVALFGSVNGSDEAGLLIEDPTLAATAANVIRGVAGNFRIGNGSSGIEHALSAVALRAGQRAFDATGVEPDDSRYALGGDYDVFTRRDYRVYQ
ncbi:MAG TPA: hypothetical protein VFG94_12795, partial [Acidimicrobiales bacterium]|nr:hypothetical protein [Acidimicrobiales bacterium]